MVVRYLLARIRFSMVATDRQFDSAVSLQVALVGVLSSRMRSGYVGIVSRVLSGETRLWHGHGGEPAKNKI